MTTEEEEEGEMRGDGELIGNCEAAAMFIPPCRDVNTDWALSRARANLMFVLAARPRRDASINCFALSPSFAAK